MPNVVGMALFADGGFVASKPYAASGAYINKMSDYCSSCQFDVKVKKGGKACPFNYLYWNFLSENENVLRKNQRMGLVMGSLRKMKQNRLDEVRSDSERFFASSEMQGWGQTEGA
mgnify:FL=1